MARWKKAMLFNICSYHSLKKNCRHRCRNQTPILSNISDILPISRSAKVNLIGGPFMLNGREPLDSSALISSLQTDEYMSIHSAIKSSASLRVEKPLKHAPDDLITSSSVPCFPLLELERY